MNIETLNINGFEEFYTIDNIGRVFSINKNRFIYGRISGSGYYEVDLYKNNVSYKFAIHRIVAEHFLEKIDLKLQVNHIDGIKTNNILDNLEWCTASENIRHAYLIGRSKSRFKYSKEQRDLAIKLRNEGYTFDYIAIIADCSTSAAKRAVYANNKSNNIS
jgi:hypothetical protein